MKMLKYILVLIVSLGFITPAFAGGNDNNNHKNCQELVLNAADECEEGETAECEYTCYALAHNGSDEPSQWSLEFYLADADFPLRGELDLPEGPNKLLGCECGATGSFVHPNFDQANWFNCVTYANDEPPTALNQGGIFYVGGHVVANGNNIIQGESVNGIGRSWVFQCVREGCECESPDD